MYRQMSASSITTWRVRCRRGSALRHISTMRENGFGRWVGIIRRPAAADISVRTGLLIEEKDYARGHLRPLLQRPTARSVDRGSDLRVREAHRARGMDLVAQL